MIRAVRWRVVPAGLLCAAIALVVAGCGGGAADRFAGGGHGTTGTHSSSSSSAGSGFAGNGSDLSAQEVDEFEKVVSDAEGTAAQAERDAANP
jgi:hypothetical protein